MAIDDNTSYELTGAQVKDLAAKIKSKAADNTFTGATSAVAGVKGIVPEPQAGDNTKYLKGDGTWDTIVPSLVEMSYGEASAWSKFINAYNAGAIVYCRASSNANPATGTQGRKAFMAYVNNATTPTEVEFQYVRSVSSKTDSQQGDQVFIYKLTNASGGTWTVTTRNMGPKIDVSGPITKTFTTGANPTVEIGASAMTGATSGTAGTAGIVPAPSAGDQDKVLAGDGTWKALTNIFYPVGSIYMSATLATAADVEAALGGTWAVWGAGRVPVGVDTSQTEFDTVEETGGEKTVTLTVDQIPSHQHRERGFYRVQGGVSGGVEARARANLSADAWDTSMEATGGGQSHNNLQPYITCYMYKRTA